MFSRLGVRIDWRIGTANRDAITVEISEDSRWTFTAGRWRSLNHRIALRPSEKRVSPGGAWKERV
jgi:hypothetical protein